MATVKFDTYQIETDGATYVGSIEWDPEVDNRTEIVQRTNKVLEALKRKDWIVSPNGEEAAWLMGKPKARGRKVEVPDDVVREIHRLYVVEDMPVATIPLPLYAKFEGIDVKPNSVKKVLNQEIGADVDGIDELREAATIKLGDGSTGGRRKYTEEDKDEWIRLHVEENMSGSAIGKQKGINSATINAHLKKEGVQRNARGRVKAVVTS